MYPHTNRALIRAIVDGERGLNIDLSTSEGNKIGRLVPLTIHHLDDDYIIQKLTEWRNANMSFFLTQFHSTSSRTRNWLQNVVFKRGNQLIFLIYDNDKVIGHYGFKDLNDSNVMLDNAMRGERGGHPKLLVIAGKTIINWLFENTNVNIVYGYIMLKNATSIMMSREIGFKGWVKHPLNRFVKNDEIHFKIGEEGEVSIDSLYCYRIEITKKDSR